MSDEALHARLVELARKAGGPNASFKKMDMDPGQHPEIVRVLRDHYEGTGGH